MKALVKAKEGKGLIYQDVGMPLVGEDDVLIKMSASSLCGTDMHTYNWDQFAASQNIKLPVIAGHEYTGEIVEVGKNIRSMTYEDLSVGDIVSGESHIFCGNCKLCNAHKQHICKSTELLGINRDGCFAEYIAVPSRTVWRHKEIHPLKINAIYEPFGNAVHAIKTECVHKKNIAVIGVGPIGLATIAIARDQCANKIVAIDKSEYRLKLAKEMGADICILLSGDNSESVTELIKDSFHGFSLDIVYEMSGAINAIQVATKIVTNGGVVIAFGIPDGNQLVEVDLATDIIFKGIKLIGVAGRKVPSTWHDTDEIINHIQDTIIKIVTNQFPLSQYEQAFDLMNSGECGKVILTF